MISEQLRATLLSLKQISDRLKLLNTNSVTKSEALVYKNEIIEAIGDIDFTEIIEALGSIEGKIDDVSTELEDVAQEATLTQGVSDIREDISNIDTSDLAKEVTLGTSSDTSVSTTIFGWLKSIRDFLVNIVTTNPYAKETTAQQAASDAAAAKTAAQAITGYALQGSGNSTQTDIVSAIGTPATGQPSTLFEAIAAGGGGGGTGDAKESTSQSILTAVEDNGDTAIALAKDIATNCAKDATVAKEAAATVNKNQVISAIGDTLSVNMLATGMSAMAGVPMHVITDDGTTTAYTLNANELYYFKNRSSDLELTLDLTTVAADDAADFHLIVQVASGASPLTVTIKDSNNNDAIWSWDIAPNFSDGVIYEIGIINNLALYVEYAI